MSRQPDPEVVYRGPWRPMNGYLGRDVRLADGRRTTELQHRVLTEERLGRDLGTDEHVHHKNERRADNVAENLEPISKAEHCRHHFGIGRTMVELVCQGCGTTFTRDVRRRNAKYCSPPCRGRAGGQASGRARQRAAPASAPAANDASAAASGARS